MPDLTDKLEAGEISKEEFIFELKYVRGKKLNQIIKNLPDTYKNDKKILRIIFGISSVLFAKASSEVKKDMDMIKLCAPRFSKTLDFVDVSLREDKNVLIECVKNKAFRVEQIPQSLMNDEDVVYMYLKKHGAHHLSKFPEKSKDFLFVEKIIKTLSIRYYYLSEDLQREPEIIKLFVKHFPTQMSDIKIDFIKDNKELIYEMYDINKDEFLLSPLIDLYESYKRADELMEKLSDKTSSTSKRKI